MATPHNHFPDPEHQPAGASSDAQPVFRRDAAEAKEFSVKQTCEIGDFLQFHGTKFLAAAYRGILLRDPDPAGWNAYKDQLLEGSMTRVDVLTALRYSAEGKDKGVKINGLRWQRLCQSARRIPLIGNFIVWCEALAQLPEIHRRLLVSDMRRHNEQQHSDESSSAELRRLAEKIRKLEAATLPSADTDSHGEFDKFYAALQEHFRGSTEKIKERLAVYRPIASAAFEAAGRAPALDVACGRGEFLELLKEWSITASGVDLNSESVERCRRLGLTVTQNDLFDELTNTESSTLSVISGFHIVEHLPVDGLLRLASEALRVLKPGGAVILETPNPAALIVGATTFYMDPTHRNPLPCEFLRFLLQSQGFSNTEIILLSPHPNFARELTDRFSDEINKIIYGPQDYAVVGWKSVGD